MDGIKKINVGGDTIGIRGLDAAIEELKAHYADKSDPEVAQAMLARLEKINYFAPTARDEYAAALLREFRKALGQPFEAGESGGLSVRVLGPGCPRCEQLFQRVTKVLAELNLPADLEAIKDTKEIAASGVLVTPGLMINGQVRSTGKLPTEQQLSQWLGQAAKE
ncbi:MAG: thioredoxin family protein [Desulfarculaceae bacterium]|nr:thioredoxin family protein [Desulfarculaceae bacterium]MCF8074444.1 thioredoxin family protein [Desulfarculaceae bacterium]MCF8102716.1 thioredoxin family protein [Desulfarculaceae bacterium]MCF8116429.1 thioredoxin family protein [Desulfarculaceae bacterium]